MLALNLHNEFNTGSESHVQQSQALTSLDALLENRAAHNIHGTALTIDGQNHSFSSLDADANRIANFLAGNGVSRSDRIALIFPKSATLYSSLMAVTKVGASFVIVDPEASSQEKSQAIKDAGVSVVIADDAAFANDLDVTVFDFDDIESTLAHLSAHRPLRPAMAGNSEEAAFFLGGRVYSQKQAFRFVRSLASVYGLTSSDVFVQSQTVAFDVSVMEVLAAWSVGGSVVIDLHSETVAEFAATANRQGATAISLVTSELANVEAQLPSVSTVIVSGEKCSSDLAVTWALRTSRVVSLKSADDKFPSFSVGEESGSHFKPRLIVNS